MAAVGGQLIETQGLAEILRDALAVGVGIAHGVEGIEVSLIGPGADCRQIRLRPERKGQGIEREQRRREESALFLRGEKNRGRGTRVWI